MERNTFHLGNIHQGNAENIVSVHTLALFLWQ